MACAWLVLLVCIMAGMDHMDSFPVHLVIISHISV